jgi:hypothetical protein
MKSERIPPLYVSNSRPGLLMGSPRRFLDRDQKATTRAPHLRACDIAIANSNYEWMRSYPVKRYDGAEVDDTLNTNTSIRS